MAKHRKFSCTFDDKSREKIRLLDHSSLIIFRRRQTSGRQRETIRVDSFLSISHPRGAAISICPPSLVEYFPRREIAQSTLITHARLYSADANFEKNKFDGWLD